MQLFLNGYSLTDIQKLNPGFTLGIIAAARVEHEWDRHKNEYINQLMTYSRESVLKVQLEAVRFVGDALTVYRRILGDAFKKYIQTGRVEDLGEAVEQINIKNYKEYVSLFMTLTGQENQKRVSGEITHTMDGPTTKTVNVGEVDGQDLLKLLDQKLS